MISDDIKAVVVQRGRARSDFLASPLGRAAGISTVIEAGLAEDILYLQACHVEGGSALHVHSGSGSLV